MNDKELLLELLAAEHEDDALSTLKKRNLFDPTNAKRWVALGNMANNQSVVHAQQSTLPVGSANRSPAKASPARGSDR